MLTDVLHSFGRRRDRKRDGGSIKSDVQRSNQTSPSVNVHSEHSKSGFQMTLPGADTSKMKSPSLTGSSHRWPRDKSRLKSSVSIRLAVFLCFNRGRVHRFLVACWETKLG